jgi:hypothetical protein
MTTVLEEYTTEEQHSVVRFLCPEGHNAKDIHKEMFLVYCGKCLSCKAIHICVDKSSQGCSRAADNAIPGRPVEIATEVTVQWVE